MCIRDSPIWIEVGGSNGLSSSSAVHEVSDISTRDSLILNAGDFVKVGDDSYIFKDPDWIMIGALSSSAVYTVADIAERDLLVVNTGDFVKVGDNSYIFKNQIGSRLVLLLLLLVLVSILLTL